MKYFIIAGEASGDLHASNLMHELKKHDNVVEFAFLGGDLMAEVAHKQPLIHYREMAFMGIVNVILNLHKISHNFKKCKKELLAFAPDAVILVDYPSFNLRIAKFVKQHTKVPVYYYISPKVWVWKEWRIKSIKKYVDKMLCILPFEKEYYKRHNYAVEYVGNPTVDTIESYKKKAISREDFIKKNSLEEGKPIIALLAGSRKQEITKCLPLMVKVAEKTNDFQIVIAGAPGIDRMLYETISGQHKVVFEQTYDLVSNAQIAVVNSGTATLETALLKTPEVVVYYVMGGRFATLLQKILLKVKYISLVNLIAGKEVVKELVAHHFTENNLEREIHRLLNDENFRKSQIEGFNSVAAKLGPEGCAAKTAETIFASLKK